MRLTLRTLSAFGSPMIAIQAFEIAWGAYLPAYIATVGAMSLATAGALLMALRLFDSIIDPAIAWASDRMPTRFGRRRPWMALGLVPLLLGIPGIFFAASGGHPAALVASALLLHLGYMMIVTPYGGWALELGADPGERLRTIAAKTWFGMIGLVLILAFPAMLERGFGIDRAGQVGALGLLIALIFPMAVLLVLTMVAEPRLPPSRTQQPRNPLRLFGAILRIRALWPVLGLYLCTGFAEAAGSAIFLMFVGDGLGLRRWGSTLILIQAAMALVTLPLWTMASRHIERRRLLILGYGWQAAMALLALLIPSASIGAAILYVVLRGLMAGFDFLFLRVIVADIARTSADSGSASGACFYSVSNLTLKLAFGMGAWVALSLLQFLSASGALPVDGGSAVRLAYVLPAACAALSALGIILFVKGFAVKPARPEHMLQAAPDPRIAERPRRNRGWPLTTA